MPTAAEFAYFPDKRLLGSTDFDARFFRYLRNESREAMKRLFIQGSFLERMPLSAAGAGRIQVGAKPTYGDRMAHDGDGHLLDLAQISTNTPFANAAAQVYEVGAGYIEYPIGIRTNPRTGAPEFDRYVEGIGVEASPTTVINNGATLTFLVNSLFETGTTVPSHAGRLVRVFKKQLASNARTEAVAIETATVTFDGANNRVTTVAQFGQTTVSTTPADYTVQLIGLSVLKNTATNRPSLQPAKMFFVGTVTGNGGTPSTFDTTAQGIIRAQAASQVTTEALGAWADGTLNPATTAQGALAKIVSDLTSTQVGTGRGAAKITAPALTGNPIAPIASRLDATLQTLLDAMNAETRRSERRAEDNAMLSLRLVATVTGAGSRPLRAITAIVNPLTGTTRQVLAVGQQSSVIYDPDVGFTSIPTSLNLVSVAAAPTVEFGTGYLAVSDAANAYALTGAPGSYVWSLSQAIPVAMQMIAYSTVASVFVAVGWNSHIWRTATGGAWLQRTAPPEIGGASLLNNVIVTPAGGFLAIAQGGQVIASSNGQTWTYHGFVPGNVIARSLTYSPEFGYTCLHHTGGGANLGVAYSTDGATWTAGPVAAMSFSNLHCTQLDRQLAFIRSHNSAPYYSAGFTQAALGLAPDVTGGAQGSLLPLADNAAFDAFFLANVNGQIFAGGRNASENGVLYMGGRFRPSFRSPGAGESV